MLAIEKTWKMAAVSAEKRLSKPRARKAKGDQARIARAISYYERVRSRGRDRRSRAEEYETWKTPKSGNK